MVKEIFLIAAVLILGQVFSSLFQKTRLPDVLPLMLVGLILGPVTHFISPDSFGKTADVFTTLALIVVLFRTGLTLRVSALREAWQRGSALTVTYFILCAGAAFLASHFLFGINKSFSLILAVITADNSFIIILPLLSKLRLSRAARTMLMIETTVGGVLAVVLALALTKMAAAGTAMGANVAWQIFYSFTAALIIGAVLGAGWTVLLAKIRTLENSISFTFASLLMVYSACLAARAEGAIGVLAFGAVIGNIRVIKTLWFKNVRFALDGFNEKEKNFFGEIEFILKTLFFVYMGICLKFDNYFLLAAGLALAVIKIAVRIPVVNLTFAKTAPPDECAIASVLCPSGLISAVLAATATQQIEGAGVIEGIIFPLIFFSVIFTAVFSYLTERGALIKLKNFFFARHVVDKEP